MERAAKQTAYCEAEQSLIAILDGEPDRIARMASIACVLKEALDHYFWAGFYLVDPGRKDELVIGPYQGSLGCLRIPFSRGVCGAAARTHQSQVVDDVHAFPGHIACDARSRSEIVVPVCDADGRLIAVFDVDSTRPGAFDAVDRDALEKLLTRLFAQV